MIEQLANRDPIFGGEVIQIDRHRRIQIDQALIDKLHERHPRHYFCHRAPQPHGVRLGRHVVRTIRHPKSLAVKDITIQGYHDREPRREIPHKAVDIGFKVFNRAGQGGLFASDGESLNGHHYMLRGILGETLVAGGNEAIGHLILHLA